MGENSVIGKAANRDIQHLGWWFTNMIQANNQEGWLSICSVGSKYILTQGHPRNLNSQKGGCYDSHELMGSDLVQQDQSIIGA